MKIYTDIFELPLVNFIKFTESGNYVHFLIDKNVVWSDSIEAECKLAFTKIIFQFDSIDAEKEKLTCQLLYNTLQFHVTGNPQYKNKAFVFEKKLLNFSEDKKIERIDYSKEIGIISKWIGFHIYRNKISLGEYLGYRKNYVEYCKGLKQK